MITLSPGIELEDIERWKHSYKNLRSSIPYYQHYRVRMRESDLNGVMQDVNLQHVAYLNRIIAPISQLLREHGVDVSSIDQAIAYEDAVFADFDLQNFARRD